VVPLLEEALGSWDCEAGLSRASIAASRAALASAIVLVGRCHEARVTMRERVMEDDADNGAPNTWFTYVRLEDMKSRDATRLMSPPILYPQSELELHQQRNKETERHVGPRNPIRLTTRPIPPASSSSNAHPLPIPSEAATILPTPLSREPNTGPKAKADDGGD